MSQPIKIFIDTDAFVAFVKQDDPHHEHVKRLFIYLKDQPITFITSNYIFLESITVISQRVSHEMAIKFIDILQSYDSPYEMKRVDETLEAVAIDIFKQQTSKNTSFVDCTNMAFIQQGHADVMFSFDSVYRRNGIRMVEDMED